MELARWVETHPLPASLRFHTALLTSEALSNQQEEFVRRTLGIAALGSIYGSAECGPVAVSPPSTEAVDAGARVFVIDRKQFVVEVVDTDGDGRVLSCSIPPEEGGTAELAPRDAAQRGELVYTSLTRHRNPVVRYRSGDFGRIYPHPSNPSWLLMELHGRDKNRHFNIDGDYIELGEIEDRVLEWQVIIDEHSHVEFRVVFDGEGPPEERALRLRQALDKEIFHGFHHFEFEVRHVGYADLVRGSMARKVRKVVDLR